MKSIKSLSRSEVKGSMLDNMVPVSGLPLCKVLPTKNQKGRSLNFTKAEDILV